MYVWVCLYNAYEQNKLLFYSDLILTAELVWTLPVRMRYVKNVKINIHISIDLLDINLNN